SGFWPELFFQLLDLAADRLPLLGRRADQRLEFGALLTQRLVLGADLHFLELAQIAQTHVENGVSLHFTELERLHQDGLRLVFSAYDLDDLVQVEVGDQIAAENLQAMLDLSETMFGPAQEDFATMIEPFSQGLGKTKYLRDAALHQHIHVEL